MNPDAIRTYLTISWMKEKQQNIKDYYTKEDGQADSWLGYTYKKVMKDDLEFYKVKFEGRLKAKI